MTNSVCVLLKGSNGQSLTLSRQPLFRGSGYQYARGLGVGAGASDIPRHQQVILGTYNPRAYQREIQLEYAPDIDYSHWNSESSETFNEDKFGFPL